MSPTREDVEAAIRLLEAEDARLIPLIERGLGMPNGAADAALALGSDGLIEVSNALTRSAEWLRSIYTTPEPRPER